MIRSLAILFASTLSIIAASPIDPVRTPAGHGSWTNIAGIPGGIPIRSNVVTNFTSSATVAQIQSAVNAAASNSVIHLAAGTYTFSTFLTVGNNGITIRGDVDGNGYPTTIINSSSHGVFIGSCCAWYNAFSSPQASNTKNWTNGLAQGSITVGVDDTNGISSGMLVYLDQLNDVDTTGYSPANPNGPYVSGEWVSIAFPTTGQDRYQFQLNKVASISGYNVTLSEPVYMPNWNASQSPHLWFIPKSTAPVVTMSGVENCKINVTANDFAAGMEWTDQCWILNCVGSQGGTVHLGCWYLNQSLRPEVRHCFQNEAAGVVDRYGIHTRVVSGALVIDNILQGSGTQLMVNGVTASVYAYNYLTNADHASSGFVPAGCITHGGMPNMCLFEGNWGYEWELDSQWQSSAYMTLFRSRMKGQSDKNQTTGNKQAVGIFYTNRHASVIGNVLGTAGVHTFYEVSGPAFGNCQDGVRVYYLGYETAGSGCNGVNDPATISTLTRAYNWTSATATNSGINKDGFQSGDIPNSLFLTSKPSFFGGLLWPPVDPATPDPDTIRTNIPAAFRFAFGVDPPLNGSPTVTTVSSGNLGLNNADLRGSVNPNSAASGGYFEYGLTIGYGSFAAPTNLLGSGSSAVNYTNSIAGLLSATTYHFRAVGTNASGTNFGNDLTFDTAGSVPPTNFGTGARFGAPAGGAIP